MHLFIGIISPTWLYGHLAPVATNVRAELLGPVPMPKRRQALCWTLGTKTFFCTCIIMSAPAYNSIGAV